MCSGEGVAAAQGATHGVDVCVGTLSKAFGAHGGFAALSAAGRQLLLNQGRPYVFSTALPVPLVAGALAALRIAVDKVRQRVSRDRSVAGSLCTDVSADQCMPSSACLGDACGGSCGSDKGPTCR